MVQFRFMVGRSSPHEKDSAIFDVSPF